MDLEGGPGAPEGARPGSLPRAAGVHWNLSRICVDAAAARVSMESTVKRAETFERQYRGRIASLSAAQLAVALKQVGEIENDFSRAASYAELRQTIGEGGIETKGLVNLVERTGETLSNLTRFVGLEWQAIDPATAELTASARELTRYRHYLKQVTAEAPHTRSEAEETMLAARETAAQSEWQTLHADVLSHISIDFDPGTGMREHTLDEMLSYIHTPDRAVRLRALDAIYDALEGPSTILAQSYNAIVGDRLAMDRIRNFSNPMQSANMTNDLPDAVVDALMDGVAARYPLAQRWFTIKAKVMNLPKLSLADQYAPLGKSREIAFSDGFDVFMKAMTKFSPRAARMLRDAAVENRIDAEPRNGKRGGAFCTPVAAGDDPFVLMNYTDSIDSVFTLAHELGHALHFILAGKAQSPQEMGTGMAMAEIASTFNEMLLFDHLLAVETDPASRAALVAGRLESGFATVFRQTMMSRYEKRAYAMKDQDGAVDADGLSKIWFEENQQYYGNSVDLPEGYKLGWSYIPHFIGTRFYTYSYSFAHLASLALYATYRAEGQPFVERYLNMLSAGGSKTPEELLGKLGIDITDPAWVNKGFAEMERMLAVAEAEFGGSGTSAAA